MRRDWYSRPNTGINGIFCNQYLQTLQRQYCDSKTLEYRNESYLFIITRLFTTYSAGQYSGINTNF